jgi:hypothetical protein
MDRQPKASLPLSGTNLPPPDSPDIIHLGGKLCAALVSSQPMIEISFLPPDSAFARMKTLPISDDFAHGFHRAQKIAARASDQASKERVLHATAS